MRAENEQTLKEVLQQLVKSYRMQGRLHQLRLEKVWAKLMGPTINGYTSELRIRKKKLYITITSAPLRQELSYSKEKLLHLLNEQLGEEYLEEVVLR